MASEYNAIEYNEAEYNQEANFLTVSLTEDVTLADVRALFVDMVPFTGTITESDAFTKLIGINLAEIYSLSDDMQTSPFLAFLQETIRLSDWLSIKRSPAREEWFN